MNHQPAHVYVGLNSLRDLAIQQFFFEKKIFLCLPYLFILYPLQDKICYMLPVLRLLIPNPDPGLSTAHLQENW